MLSDTEHRIREVEQILRLLQYNARVLTTRTDKVDFDVKTVRPRPAGDPSSGSATWTVTVLCQGAGVTGFTVSLTLGGTTLTAATNFSGVATFTLSTAGTWSGTASKSGFTTQTFSVVFAGSTGSTTVNVFPTPVTISGNVSGGTCLLPASIVVKQSGSTVGTTTANTSGNYSLSVPNDGTAYTVTASHSRYDNGITTFSLTSCASTKTVNFTLAVSNGYHGDGCNTAVDPTGCGCCPLPAPDTLYINHGGYTLMITDQQPTPLTVTYGALSGGLVCADPVCATSAQSVTIWLRYAGGLLEGSWARCAIGTTCANMVIPDSVSGANAWNSSQITSNKWATANCISGTNNPFLRTFDGSFTTFLGSGATVTE